VPEKYLLFERFKTIIFLLVILTIYQGEKKCFEAMPIKWINQSRRRGHGPPDVQTNVIGWPSEVIYEYLLGILI